MITCLPGPGVPRPADVSAATVVMRGHNTCFVRHGHMIEPAFASQNRYCVPALPRNSKHRERSDSGMIFTSPTTTNADARCLEHPSIDRAHHRRDRCCGFRFRRLARHMRVELVQVCDGISMSEGTPRECHVQQFEPSLSVETPPHTEALVCLPGSW